MGETYWATGTVEFLCPCVWNALNAFFSGGLSESPKVSKRGLWGDKRSFRIFCFFAESDSKLKTDGLGRV
jgi:hypothetical protein